MKVARRKTKSRDQRSGDSAAAAAALEGRLMRYLSTGRPADACLTPLSPVMGALAGRVGEVALNARPQGVGV
jgi:hypothetical protein